MQGRGRRVGLFECWWRRPGDWARRGRRFAIWENSARIGKEEKGSGVVLALDQEGCHYEDLMDWIDVLEQHEGLRLEASAHRPFPSFPEQSGRLT